MKVSAYNYGSQVLFGGQNDKRKKNPIKLIAPLVIGGILVAGGAKSCSGNQSLGYSGIDNHDGITVQYTNVSKQTRDSVMKPVYDIKSHLQAENDFLEGTKYDIAYSFGEMSSNDKFMKYLIENKARNSIKGTSFYSDGKLQNRIALQEISHNASLPLYSEMRQTVMHETGHQFDNYFGHNHNADYALKWDSLMNEKNNPYNFETITDTDIALDNEYNYNNSLSDKKEFKMALLKDLQYISRAQFKEGILPENIEYYIRDFDFGMGITLDDISGANNERAEIYASLFSYIMGQDDGNREKFLKCFRHSHNVVRQDISKYLGIKK